MAKMKTGSEGKPLNKNAGTNTRDIQKNKIHVPPLMLALVLTLALAGCGDGGKPNPKNTVTLTVWHTYVEGMKTGFDELIDEFNYTVGAKNGITVKVTAIANSSVINEKLVAAANRDPGAPEMPDMAVVYPKVAVTLAEKGVLMDFGTQFSKTELANYVPQFLEEGRLGGDTLYVLPIAKSTEVLYLNKTIFERFATDTGVSIEQLATFEGIVDASEKYYAWTDAKTPGVPNDGKMFYYPDGLFNYSMIGFEQLGGAIVKDQRLNLSDPIFERIWNSYFPPAVRGGVAIYNDYGNYLAVIGDIVCTTSTSAGSSFYPHSITYADNTKENVTFEVLPYPVFEGGAKVAFQRGGGVCVMKSDAAKEYAAAVFLKWFTQPAQNLRFTASTGYLPVTQPAFDDILANRLPEIENNIVKKALITTAAMQKDYRFYYPPMFDGFDGIQTKYVERLQKAARQARNSYHSLLAEQDAPAFDTASKDARTTFVNEFMD
jgi:multiple sugar transport system substrate-binding protein